MHEFIAGQLLDWYERIEKGVLTFAEHVPLGIDNENFEAPMLASYLSDAGGLIDSVFRDMTTDDVSGWLVRISLRIRRTKDSSSTSKTRVAAIHPPLAV